MSLSGDGKQKFCKDGLIVFYITDENKDMFPNKFEVSVEDEDTILTNVQQESDEVGGGNIT